MDLARGNRGKHEALDQLRGELVLRYPLAHPRYAPGAVEATPPTVARGDQPLSRRIQRKAGSRA